MATDCVGDVAVDEVYPTGEILPENLLRFYIYFSGPMEKANALDAIALLDKNGTAVDGVFLANKVDLWSPDAQRLTLLFDPGRVKTGLVAHNTMGRALRSGERYTLFVDQSILAADGCTIAGSFSKEFEVTNADFESPDLAKWDIQSPKAGTFDWLSMTLNGSHDHVSLAYRVRVIDSTGAIVGGQIALNANESEWRFKPASVWNNARYQIVVDPMLEDIVGNRLTGSFEEPVSDEQIPAQLLTFHPR